jgi:uncharacterized membrane protein YqjE
MMDRSARATEGVAGLFALFRGTLGTRVDLARVELEIHLRSLLRPVLWALAATACAMLAVALGTTALVGALWSTHRMLALAAGSAAFVVVGALLGYLGARGLNSQPELLQGSLEQLKRDQRRAGQVQ